MTARDEYPFPTVMATGGTARDTYEAMCDEIDRLRRQTAGQRARIQELSGELDQAVTRCLEYADLIARARAEVEELADAIGAPHPIYDEHGDIRP